MEIDKHILYNLIYRFIHSPEYATRRYMDRFNDKSSEIFKIEIDNFEFISDKLSIGTYDLNGDLYSDSSGTISTYITILYKTSSGYSIITKNEFLRIFYSNYLTELRDFNLSEMDISISNKIKKSLDSYLEFNSDEIFIKSDLSRIFGGSIRDIIAEMPIHDIDILCGSLSASRIGNLLISNGYKYIDSLTPKDLSGVYTDIKIICEPHSYIKGDKVVQLIRPRPESIVNKPMYKIGTQVDLPDRKLYERSINDLISNVDISCCGVSYNGISLIEDVKDAVSHCRSKIFKVNEYAKMSHKERLIHRRYKLMDRGWE